MYGFFGYAGEVLDILVVEVAGVWIMSTVVGTWAEGRLGPSLAEARWPSAVGQRGAQGGG